VKRRRSRGLAGRILRRRHDPSVANAALGQASDPVPWTVVTGGSAGIGPELARAFIDHNPELLLVARDAAAVADVAQEITSERLGKRPEIGVHWQNMDLTLDNAARRIEARVADSGGYVDLLILNAGMGLSGPFTEQSAGELEQLIGLNVAAVTRLAHHFLAGMVARGEGGIIIMSSLGGFVPGPYQAAYYASKAYGLALSEALAEEVAGTGVRVMAVAPGAVNTEFHEKMGAENSLYLRLPGRISKERVAKSARFGYLFGQRTVVPGILPKLGAVALRLLPHSLTVPLMRRLLRPRKET